MREPDWKKMYMTMVHNVNDALELIPHDAEHELARYYLMKGLLEAENIYLKTAGIECDGKPITVDAEIDALRAECC